MLEEVLEKGTERVRPGSCMVTQEGRAKPERTPHAMLRSLRLRGKSWGAWKAFKPEMTWSDLPLRKLAWVDVWRMDYCECS